MRAEKLIKLNILLSFGTWRRIL